MQDITVHHTQFSDMKRCFFLIVSLRTAPVISPRQTREHKYCQEVTTTWF